MNRCIIISGGPGAGKTALVAALSAAGYPCFDEVSRQMIREQRACGGELFPWADMAGFVEACLTHMARQPEEARAHRLSFFDRGVPDLIGYLYYRGLVPSPELLARATDYTPLVFMAPPWREIFVNDAERPQTFEEAAAIHRELCRAYRECGFTLLTLPLATVAARVVFVQRALANTPAAYAGAT
ncbi:MAG: AAA family ATPase [Opitutaceae bacterium]|nr:AAA family ATPase [Opitutaceae bacterium]